MIYERKTLDEFRVLQKCSYGHGWELLFKSSSRDEAREKLRTFKDGNKQSEVKLKKVRIPLGS
jgi:hypothetical protein